jgi:transposase
MISRAYRATDVNRVDARQIDTRPPGQPLVVGIDMGKYEMLAVARWPGGRFERPWRVLNPTQVPELVALLQALAQSRPLTVALEPSGTYGDALRQALSDARVVVHRVSPKAAHDYAEIFDGVPSQHDGKDAAVVAELAALGKSEPWPYRPAGVWEQELAYGVDWLGAHRRILVMWLGRIEARLARHWPEATQVLDLSSATLLRVLARYGGPADLAADPKAVAQLRQWGGRWLAVEKAQQLVTTAAATVGVRQGEVERAQLRAFAEEALRARHEVARSRARLRRLAQGHPVLEAQGRVVGVATACVLWVGCGDPRDYHCGRAYVKAMGLNLVERSSGICQGKLHISKRGCARVRQWLYFAALRLVSKPGVKQWYQARQARGDGPAKGALVGVMRKLALALYHVGARGAEFAPGKLFPGGVVKAPGPGPEVARR